MKCALDSYISTEVKDVFNYLIRNRLTEKYYELKTY